jgi:hypothetical protein
VTFVTANAAGFGGIALAALSNHDDGKAAAGYAKRCSTSN